MVCDMLYECYKKDVDFQFVRDEENHIIYIK